MRLSASLVVAVTAVLFLGCPPPVSTITLVATPSTLALDLGASKTVSASQAGLPATSATWSSNNDAVATVVTNGDGTATVRGVTQGSATITAKSGALEANIAVTVGPAVLTRIELSPGSPSIALGTKLQLNATAVSSDGIKRDVTSETTWRAVDSTIVTVSNTGEATSVALGAGTISAEYRGLTASVRVVVTNASMTSLTVAPATVDLITGNTRQLNATARFSDGSSQDLTTQVTWSSSAPNVAAVDSLGVVRGVTMGTATITATRGGFTATTTVTTTTATLMSIELSPTTLSIARGLTRQLTVSGRYSNGQTQPVTSGITWASSSASTATVSGTGLLTAVMPGTATITATVGSFSSNLALTVTNATVSTIVITPAAPSLGIGRSLQLTATGTFTDGTMQPVTNDATWSSATAASATVSNAMGSQGLLNAVALGTSEVSATIGAVTGRVTVTITAAELASIALTPSTLAIAKGRTQEFTATGTYTDSSTSALTELTWSSSDGGVLSITDAGLATAVDEGAAMVLATSGSIIGTADVTVGAAELVSIALTPNPATVAATSTLQFTATGTFSDTTTGPIDGGVSWSSSDAGVATVSMSGLATGVSEGETNIVATHGSVQGTAVLTVTRALTSITVTPAVATVGVNGTRQFTAVGNYSDSSTEDLTTQVTWNSSNTAGATIDASGLATGHAVSVVNITATLGSTTSNVTVLTVAL
ncbi:MAG: beta strand repeat-containing protein [Archangium sp.]